MHPLSLASTSLCALHLSPSFHPLILIITLTIIDVLSVSLPSSSSVSSSLLEQGSRSEAAGPTFVASSPLPLLAASSHATPRCHIHPSSSTALLFFGPTQPASTLALASSSASSSPFDRTSFLSRAPVRSCQHKSPSFRILPCIYPSAGHEWRPHGRGWREAEPRAQWTCGISGVRQGRRE